MYCYVDAVVCQPLGGCCDRNQGADTAVGKEDLTILACEIGVQTCIFGGRVGVDDHGVPVVTHFRFLRSRWRVGIANDFGVGAIDPSGIRQFTNGIMTYPCEPLTEAYRRAVCVAEFFLAPIDGAGGLTPV